MISLQDFPRIPVTVLLPWSDFQDTRIPPARRTEKNNNKKKHSTISASTRCTERIETAKYSVLEAGIGQSLSFTLNFVYPSLAFSFSLSVSLSLLSPFVDKLNEYITLIYSFLQNFPLFFYKAVRQATPLKKNRGMQHRVFSVSIHIGVHGGADLWTDGRK